MRVAVFADIHSNYIALEGCINYALKQRVETFLFLGDYLGECGQPEKTMDMLYALKERYTCYFVKGNKEECWLGYVQNGPDTLEYGNSITGTLLYQYERRRRKEQDFFEGLPLTQTLQWEGLPSVLICHGSPLHTNQPMKQENDDCFEIMDNCKEDIILCGHTHRRRTIYHGEKIVYNPGSVGAPLESGGKAQFMILHGEEGQWTTEYVDLEYDVEKVISELHEEKLDEYAPYWCQVTELLLRTGEVSHGKVLRRVMEGCRAETGECVWPYISEKYWEPVLEEVKRELRGENTL